MNRWPLWNEDGSGTDWLGNQFKIGDRVVYCIGAGRGQQMAVGVVVETRRTSWTRPVYEPAPQGADLFERGRYLGMEEYGDPVAEVKVQRLACSGYEGEEKKAARWVNEMNVTAVHGLADAAERLGA